MNPVMEAAFQLETGTDNPEAPIPMQDGTEVSPDALAASGVDMSAQWMAANGPYQPTHAAPKTITKAQYKEQMMREEQGYPSNPDESAKVVALEGKIDRLAGMIEAVLGGQDQDQDVKPYVIGETLRAPPGPPPGLGATMKDHMAHEKQSPTPSPTASPESKERKVTLSDGRQISVPALSLGPASANTESVPIVVVPDGSDDGWDTFAEVAGDPMVPPKPDSRHSTLATQVMEFLSQGDPHRFFRRHLSGVHRHVGYNGWAPETKTEFDERFKGFLSDRTFIENICEKIVWMEFGHALADKHAASMVVATAGFTAFALCGLGDK